MRGGSAIGVFVFAEHADVAVVTGLGDPTGLNGLLDSAVAFVNMGAIWKFTVGNEIDKFDEVHLEFMKGDLGDFVTANPGGVDDVSTDVQP